LKLISLFAFFSLTSLQAAEVVNCYIESNNSNKEHLTRKCLVELATRCYLNVRERDPLKKGQIKDPKIDVSGSIKVFFTNNPNAKGSANCQEIPSKLTPAVLNGNVKSSNRTYSERDVMDSDYNPHDNKGEDSKAFQMQLADWECARKSLNREDFTKEPNDFVVIRGPESESPRNITINGVPTKYRTYKNRCIIFD
jgi:hypothetical protein